MKDSPSHGAGAVYALSLEMMSPTPPPSRAPTPPPSPATTRARATPPIIIAGVIAAGVVALVLFGACAREKRANNARARAGGETRVAVADDARCSRESEGDDAEAAQSAPLLAEMVAVQRLEGDGEPAS